MNIWDIILTVMLAAAATGAITASLRRKRKGGCGCGCENCSGNCTER